MLEITKGVLEWAVGGLGALLVLIVVLSYPLLGAYPVLAAIIIGGFISLCAYVIWRDSKEHKEERKELSNIMDDYRKRMWR